jgi:hypothetical protein
VTPFFGFGWWFHALNTNSRQAPASIHVQVLVKVWMALRRIK